MKSDNMAAVSVRVNPVGVAIIGAVSLLVMMYVFGIPSMFMSEPKVNMKELLSVSIDLAERGGKIVKQIREQNSLDEKVKGETKEGAKEMLTDGDLSSHRAMTNGFTKVYPKLKFISEEHETKPFDLSSIAEPNKNRPEVKDIDGQQNIPYSDITIWIDPLDATQEYTENLQQYVTTMVCIAVRGNPTIGVIHHAFSGETVWGYVGYGHDPKLDSSPGEKKEGDPYRIIVSRSHAGEVESVAKSAFGDSTEVIPAGGAGYKTVQVIKGNADAYVHVTRIKKWDICAGNAIIMSVNGRMTTLENRNIDYSAGDPLNDNGLLATRFHHEKFVEILKPAAQKLREKNDEENKLKLAQN